MNEIQLVLWRDIAIKYLSAAQQFREEVKARPTEDRESQSYAMGLWHIADKTMARREATGAERAAANVLLAITDYELYDHSDAATAKLYKARNVDTDPEKMRDAMLQGIANAVKTLANVTGRDIPMDDPVVYFVAPTMPTDAPAENAPKSDNKVTSNWILQVQSEAATLWLKLKGMNCSPTKNNIKADLAKICREKEIKTDHGIYPTADYIYRHVLRGWTPPTD